MICLLNRENLLARLVLICGAGGPKDMRDLINKCVSDLLSTEDYAQPITVYPIFLK